MKTPEGIDTTTETDIHSSVVQPKTRRKRRVLRECHICHAKMDARGINGHLRKHGIGKIARKRKQVIDTVNDKHIAPDNHVPFPQPQTSMDSYLEGYRKGIMDGMKMRQSA